MPNQIIVPFVFLFLLLAPPPVATAAFKGGSKPLPMHMWPGGSSQPGIARVSVEQARAATAETPVIVRGNIVQHIESDQYVFRDATSSILVNIPENSWPRQDVTPKTIVELEGELWRSPTSTRLRVAKLTRVE